MDNVEFLKIELENEENEIINSNIIGYKKRNK